MDKDLIYMANTIYNFYIDNEQIKRTLPINNIKFVKDLPNEVLNAQPELKTKNGLNEETLQNYSGYTLLYPDNTSEILIDLGYAMQNNFLWYGTLIHEVTHVKDYANYIGILNYDRFDEMLYCLYFWYWTEFHAKYKGCQYMLYFAEKLQDKYKNQYKEAIITEINNFHNVINQKKDYHLKICNTVHMIGEILAFEQSNIAMPNKFYNSLIEKYDWFEGTKIFYLNTQKV